MGVSLFETSFNPINDSWNSIDLSSANFFVDIGDQFTIALSGFDPVGNLFKGVGGNQYSGGELWLDGQVFFGGEVDMTFTTYVDNAPVPEPATMLLFGTGLAGLVGSRLRRKKK